MIKQYNFLLESKLITVYSARYEEAEILAHQVLKEVKQAFNKD